MVLGLAIIVFIPIRSHAVVGDTFLRDNWKYVILTEDGSTGTVEIGKNGSVSGNMIIPDTVVNKGIIYNVTSISDYAFCNCYYLTSITIPDSVTSIGSNAFYDCDNLTSITIPNGVTSIENNTFYGCNSLNGIIIPNGVTSIGEKAFHNCDSLTSLTIPNNVNSIESGAFSGCNSLNSIIISDSVTSIGSYVFEYCRSLKNITIPDSVTSIGERMFSYCESLTNIVIPDSVTSIAYSAFQGCTSLASITIPESVTSISSSAFAECRSLNSITIPDSVSSIASSTFYGCNSLNSIIIPDSVTFIESGAFYECKSLAGVYFLGDAPKLGDSVFKNTNATIYYLKGTNGWTDRWGNCSTVGCAGWLTQAGIIYVYQSDGTASVAGYTGKVNVTIIPEIISVDSVDYSVTSIGKRVFYYCQSLSSIVIGNNVTAIGNSLFYGCENLTNVVIGNNVTSIEYCAFYECSNLANVVIGNNVASIELEVFYNCQSLTSVEIPDSVTSIGSSAFDGCSSLISVMIGNGVTSIGNRAFYKCSSLYNVLIGNSVNLIGSGAFYKCSSLNNVYFKGNVPNLGNKIFDGATPTIYYLKGIKDWSNPWESCPAVECAGWIIQEGIIYVYQSDGTAFVTGYTGKVDTVVIPEMISIDSVDYGVTSIGKKSFYECSSLTSVVISNGVTYIEDNAFYNCDSLINIEIGNSVTYIGYDAFYECSNLTSILIPDSVNYIDGYAFSECNRLTSAYFKGDAPTLYSRYIFPIFVTIYYLKGASGWTDPWGERPTVECKGWITQDGIIYAYKSDGMSSVAGYTGKVDVAVISEVISVDSIDYSVTSIGDYAFYRCGSVDGVVIPNSITSIGYNAFYNCSSLSCVVIGNSVTSIGSLAFYDCDNLISVYFGGDMPSLGSEVFNSILVTTYYLKGTNGWKAPLGHMVRCDGWIIQEGIIYIYQSDGSASVTGHMGKVDVVVIPEVISLDSVDYRVMSIRKCAFYRCDSLTSITIPDSVTSIEERVFYECKSLTDIYFLGDAPRLNMWSNILYNTPATIYYLEGTEGWTNPWENCPTVMIREENLTFTCKLESDYILLKWIMDAVLQVSVNTEAGWNDITEGVQIENGTYIYKVPTTAKQSFYRLKIP